MSFQKSFTLLTFVVSTIILFTTIEFSNSAVITTHGSNNSTDPSTIKLFTTIESSNSAVITTRGSNNSTDPLVARLIELMYGLKLGDRCNPEVHDLRKQLYFAIKEDKKNKTEIGLARMGYLGNKILEIGQPDCDHYGKLICNERSNTCECGDFDGDENVDYVEEGDVCRLTQFSTCVTPSTGISACSSSTKCLDNRHKQSCTLDKFLDGIKLLIVSNQNYLEQYKLFGFYAIRADLARNAWKICSCQPKEWEEFDTENNEVDNEKRRQKRGIDMLTINDDIGDQLFSRKVLNFDDVFSK